MAGWATGSFENDKAQGWLPQLTSLSVEDLRSLLSRAADSPDYLDAQEASVAIAAAEAIAALKGEPSPATPKEIADWAQKAKSDGSIPDLAGLAIRAVKRVRTNSELKDLWLEADGLNEWSANLRDLENRLAG